MKMITNIRILKNNYVWFLIDNSNEQCIIIDPGCFSPVFKYIKKNNWNPIAILITHNHVDHTDGVKKLLFYYPNLLVYGPCDTLTQGTNMVVSERNKEIQILNYRIKIIETPGHTPYHISYYIKPYLFCGDIIFLGGCGRVYKNLYHLMYHSINKILLLPNNTLMCYSHEYSFENFSFLNHLLPQFKNIDFYLKKFEKLIFNKKNAYPITLEQEKKINIFLNCTDIKYQKEKKFNYNKLYPWDFFKYLRISKNNFFGARRDRTADLLRAKQALFHLSYSPYD